MRRAEREAQSAQETHVERRAGRQAAAQRQFGVEEHIKAAKGMSLRSQDVRYALNEIEPAASGPFFSELEFDNSAAGIPARCAHAAVRPRRQLHMAALRNRRRQHKAAVVIGVLADEIDPARRVGGDNGIAMEECTKARHDVVR